MSFDPITSPVDHVVINGQRSPGVAVVEGAGSPRQWDERRGYGTSGAISVYRGAKLAKFTVKFTLTTAAEFAAWAEFAPLLARPVSRARPRALTISHPILEDLGISQCAVEDLRQPTPGDTGDWTYEVAFIQFRRPAPALARPDGAEDGPQIDDPLDRQIAENTRIIQSLARDLDQ